MQASDIRWSEDSEGAWLCLRVPLALAREMVDKFKGKPIDAEIKAHRERRSLDANAYCWVLLDKLSTVLRVPAVELYREYIRDVGGNSETVPIRNDAVDRWVKNWGMRGIGWVCDVLDACKTEGYTYVKTYFGSSTYDTAQMSRLIDLIVDDCKAQGIETMTPQELDALKSRWGDVA